MKYPQLDSKLAWKRQHKIKFFTGMFGFGIMMSFSLFFEKKIDAGIFIDAIIALLPVIPFLWSLSAFLENLKTMDELWKKIHSDSLIMTALITIVFSLSFGMLQIMNVIQTFSIFYLFPFMSVIWSICFAYLNVKYNGIEENEE